MIVVKKVLYVSNIEVPYRTEFFNQLSKKCDLTVLYERKKSSNRNEKWTSSKKGTFKSYILNGLKIKNENSFSFKITKYLNRDYDLIILGCSNSIVQIYASIIMKILKIKFYYNIDGEYFYNCNAIKRFIKKSLLKMASGYFVAGEKSAERVKKIVNSDKVYCYNFSSLSLDEIIENSKQINNGK